MPSIPEPQFPELENGITMPTAQQCEEEEVIKAHETPHGCPGQEKCLATAPSSLEGQRIDNPHMKGAEHVTCGPQSPAGKTRQQVEVQTMVVYSSNPPSSPVIPLTLRSGPCQVNIH